MTQQIAADVHDRLSAGAIRFPSELDGNACFAVLEDRGALHRADDPTALSDPPPEPLQNVCAARKFVLEPCPPAT